VFHIARRRRGLTMTELLTVVSVITILTTMMSPVLLRVQQEGYRAKCTTNLKQINLALATVANQQNGKLPKCFDLNGTSVDEDSWWYRKIARVAYPTGSINGTQYDYLSVPRSDDSAWDSYSGPLKKFSPDTCILRCPSTTDHYDERKQANDRPQVTKEEWKDKDRVYDDCYGYNNTRFEYTGVSADSPLFPRDGKNFYGRSKLYHHFGGGINQPITGSYDNSDEDYTYIGWLSDIPQAAQTILIMDYLKADAAPDNDVKTLSDGRVVDGYRFRHGGKANVLFVDGHIEGYREHLFRSSIADNTIHWSVKKRP
jgi:prepilin-type processing-associated H-X9-DG protein/prepilin-type N-terminal cleavage/methylation domain-containing protein